MSGRVEVEHYKVLATYNGQSINFTVAASSSGRAVAESRRMAKAQGMNRIFVNSVRFVDEDELYFELLCTTFLEGRGIHADHVMSLEEIDSEIRYFLGDDVTLKVIEENGELLLDDGPNGRESVQGISALELIGLLYGWATFVGLTSLGFSEYLSEVESTEFNPDKISELLG